MLIYILRVLELLYTFNITKVVILLWEWFFLVYFPKEYKVEIFWEKENMKGGGAEEEGEDLFFKLSFSFF